MKIQRILSSIKWRNRGQRIAESAVFHHTTTPIILNTFEDLIPFLQEKEIYITGKAIL